MNVCIKSVIRLPRYNDVCCFSAADLYGEASVKQERADTPDSIGGYEYMTIGMLGSL